jgi:hypothetical protein
MARLRILQFHSPARFLVKPRLSASRRGFMGAIAVFCIAAVDTDAAGGIVKPS